MTAAAIAVREGPLLFSGPMVRGIQEDRKGQTRRTRGLDHVNEHPERWRVHRWDRGHVVFENLVSGARHGVRCPYGQAGDHLWVRETHALEDDESRVVYAADREARYFNCLRDQIGEPFYLASDYKPDRWRPSIHMPRWASRITLELTGVCVERLQDISEADAIAEGATRRDAGWSMDWSRVGTPSRFAAASPVKGRDLAPLSEQDVALVTARHAFGNLWDSLNGPRGLGWDVNPWAWVLAFRAVAVATPERA